MSDILYKIRNLKKEYGEKDNRVEVLKGINVDIEKGSVFVILGPSGSGKSTLLNIIGGLENADSGSIMYGDVDITKLNNKELTYYRRENLGHIFQFYNLISNLTVKENIESGRNLAKNPLDVDELMEVLELTDHQKKFPRHLSGGQQQRVAIARALAKNPKVLICDEPTGALDHKMSIEILKLLNKVKEKYGMTILIVTHNEAIKEMGDYVIKIKDGINNGLIHNETLKKPEDLEW